jgi:hypothetical protein
LLDHVDHLGKFPGVLQLCERITLIMLSALRSALRIPCTVIPNGTSAQPINETQQISFAHVARGGDVDDYDGSRDKGGDEIRSMAARPQSKIDWSILTGNADAGV